MFFSSISDAKGQEKKNVNDSIRTLKILKKTLNEIIEKNKMAEDPNFDMEIDGLIMDETMTKVGRDFYDMFFSVWIAPEKVKNYTVTIKEMVMPGIATEISVLVNESLVFKQKVQPRYDVLEQMTKYANQRVVQYLNNYEKMKAQLGGDDQEGSGIF
ncbi:curli production assembly/transport protein CsgE [Labilibaculum sp. DW002]|jgi:curli production assembly/transport component CsgE|uniref:Curli production assembly/transport component CsgE n=1 Tax=Paralabilibaculum antarcticum TaxID=2912572 RepID=A0ABT5VNV5_9BACT|nr:CsgE family curli-type amyloid fiber assembly protein [Labilibaculum sp. DW002]MDE5417114.1 curli production assembly/transport protein CsgE [Labilibaculum sp. DW002]